MVEILLKYIQYTPTLANEKQLHEIVREMRSFCQPNTKLSEVRKAYENKTLLDYILDTDMKIEDEEKVERLRALNMILDTSPKADGRLWTKLAQKFAKKGDKDQVLRYIEMAINSSCEKEATNFLLEQLEDEEILKEEIPPSLFKAAFMASIDADQLTSLLRIMPKRDQKVQKFDDYIEQMKISIELNNNVGFFIVKEQGKNPSEIKKMLELIMKDKKVSDRVRAKLLYVLLQGLPKDSELAESIKDLQQNYETMGNIKNVIKKSEEEEKLDEKEFLNNKIYREQIINKYAKLMIGMNLSTSVLMSYLKGSDYAVMVIAALFDKPLPLDKLTKECNTIIEAAKLDSTDLITKQILPICKTNTHFLYCIGKLVTEEDKEVYNTLKLAIKEPIQYFYDFNKSFTPKEPEIPEDYKQLIKSLISKNSQCTNFLHNLYMTTYKEMQDDNVYLYYNLLSQLKNVKYKTLEPLLVFPLWLLKKLDWIRPQFGRNRNKYIKSSATSAYKWTFSKITLESFLTTESEKTAKQITDYLETLIEFEIRKQPESLSIGIISTAIHKLIKKQLLSLKENQTGNLLLSELFYKLFKVSTTEATKLFKDIKTSLELYSVIDHCIKSSDKIVEVLISVFREYADCLEIVGKFVDDVLQSLVDVLVSHNEFPPLPFYYGLSFMKLNEELNEIKNKWEIAKTLQAYLRFSKTIFPKIANNTFKRLWNEEYSGTLKKVIFIMFEPEFSVMYGEEGVRSFLVKNVLEQLGTSYKDLKTKDAVIEFIKDYLKNNPKAKAKEYSSLLALGMISTNYIEKVHKDDSKVVEFLLDVLEEAGYIEMKTDFAI